MRRLLLRMGGLAGAGLDVTHALAEIRQEKIRPPYLDAIWNASRLPVVHALRATLGFVVAQQASHCCGPA